MLRLPAAGRLLLAIVVATGGCTGSRWARKDPVYAKKYDRHTDNPAKVVKQAIDARHVAGRGGGYVSLGVNDSPIATELAIGGFSYPEAAGGALEARLGLRGIATEGDDSRDNGGIAGGIEAGARLQSPTRFSPFIGASVFGGQSLVSTVTTAISDEAEAELAFAVAPEVGVHFWFTPRWRLTGYVSQTFAAIEGSGSGQYTTGGIAVSYLNIPGYRYPRRKRSTYRDPAVRRLPTCSDQITSGEDLALPNL